MPAKSCFATVLAFALLTGQSPAQQPAERALPVEPTTGGASGTAAAAPAQLLRDRIASAWSGREPQQLVQPAVLETPERGTAGVEPASHAAPSSVAGPAEIRTQPVEGAGPAATSDGAASDARPQRDSGFPPLAPRAGPSAGGKPKTPSTEGLGAVITVISSLAVVLGLFFVTAWVLRRGAGGTPAMLPSDVFETLGRAPLTARQHVQLLRCGTRLLLVSVTPDSAETLTEIDDPDEAARLAGLCRANQAGSASAAFRQVLHQFARQQAEPGFVGTDDRAAARSRLSSGLEDHRG